MAKLKDMVAKTMVVALETGKPITIVLKRGLRIEIQVVFRQVTLKLSRKGKYPSGMEWETVLKSFAELPRDPWGKRPLIEHNWITPKDWYVVRGKWALKDMREKVEGMEWVR